MNSPVNIELHSIPTITTIHQALRDHGSLVVPTQHFDVATFGKLLTQLCQTLTFDPARSYAAKGVQTVDAGTAAVGLHIENGNTPLPPDVVAFYSKRASPGANTTLCDGAQLLEALPGSIKKLFQEAYTMTRFLPKTVWQRYVASALNIDEPESVTRAHLDHFMTLRPGQRYDRAADDGIDYCLTITAIRTDNYSGKAAFANALLGPSYNYVAPIYRFGNGDLIDDALLLELAAVAERYTGEIPWQDGDLAIIDNKRVMHGRREITGPLSERELYIAMGLNGERRLPQHPSQKDSAC